MWSESRDVEGRANRPCWADVQWRGEGKEAERLQLSGPSNWRVVCHHLRQDPAVEQVGKIGGLALDVLILGYSVDTQVAVPSGLLGFRV